MFMKQTWIPLSFSDWDRTDAPLQVIWNYCRLQMLIVPGCIIELVCFDPTTATMKVANPKPHPGYDLKTIVDGTDMLHMLENS